MVDKDAARTVHAQKHRAPKARGKKVNGEPAAGASAAATGPNSRSRGRDRKEVQLLLEKGKSKGFLTYDEVNDALPPEMVTSDQIDDLMVLLGDEEIEVVSSASQAKPPAPRQTENEETDAAAARSAARRGPSSFE